MKTSLEQLEAFSCVADAGSFSGAARKLGKAQSTISTAIANLEIDLGLELFDRTGRYPIMTVEGEVLLRDVRLILKNCNNLWKRAENFSETIDAKIKIAVEGIIPHDFLIEVLAGFASEFPQTELEILSGTLGDIEKLVKTDRADLGLLVPINEFDKSLKAKKLSKMVFYPMVAANHPLAHMKTISHDDFCQYREFCIISQGGDRLPESYTLGSRPWMIENNYITRDLVLRGLGFSFMPRYLVQQDLEKGRLVILPNPSEEVHNDSYIYLIQDVNKNFGSAGDWLIKAFSGLRDME
ncbi:MAG: LysR family transcriptional regulator [Desulfotalea sp.]